MVFQQVLLYLERKLAEPILIFIKWPVNASNIITQVVEEKTTIEEVMQIMIDLEVRKESLHKGSAFLSSALLGEVKESITASPRCFAAFHRLLLHGPSRRRWW